MDPLGEQFLAGAAFASDQDGRMAGGKALGQLQHLTVGLARAVELFEPVTRGEGTWTASGADALIRALHGGDVLAGEHQAGTLAILQDRQEIADHGVRAQPDHPVFLATAIL
ncbi:Uncharacterised protein [Acinetobacter baumannii]|nr:Uncharacterised protein [Acinetobacter baumannii]